MVALAFSPDGRTLAVGTSGDALGEPAGPVPCVRLWDVASGQPLGRPLPESFPVYRLAFSPRGDRLLTAESGGRLGTLWDTAAGRAVGDGSLREATWVVAAFSPDGTRLLTGSSEGQVRVWDTATGRTLTGSDFTHPGGVTALAFSPDGRRALVGGGDGTARLWDLATRQALGPPVVLRHPMAGVAFAPDGRTFLTTGTDGGTRTWPVPAPGAATDVASIRRTLEAQTGRRMVEEPAAADLTDEEWRLRRTENGQPAADVAAWHDARACDAEEDDHPFAAAWHLDRLAVLRPHDWLTWARRGEALYWEGRPAEADASFRRAAELAPLGALPDWFRQRAEAWWFQGSKDRCKVFLGRAEAALPGSWEPIADRLTLSGRYVADPTGPGALETPAERDADFRALVARGAPADLLCRLADAEAWDGHWRRAVELYGAAAGRGTIPWADYALACLRQGDQVGRIQAQDALRRERHPPWDVAAAAAWALALTPSSANDATEALALADAAGAEFETAWAPPQSRASLRCGLRTVRALALARAGRVVEATAAARAAADERRPLPDPRPWLVLALARLRQGDRADARAALVQARQERDMLPRYTPWQERLHTAFLEAEVAARLLGSPLLAQ